MKTTRLFLLAAMALSAAVFTGCNGDKEWKDPDPLKEKLEFNSAGAVFRGENAGGLTNAYVATFSNTNLTRSSEVAAGETLSLELAAPVSDDVHMIPAGTYTFSTASAANSIVAGSNSHMSSIYSSTAKATRQITGGSVTLDYADGKFTLAGQLASNDYRFSVDYTGTIDVPSDYSRVITFEAAPLMQDTGNGPVYNDILWGIDLAGEDPYELGGLWYDDILYSEKGAGFGHFWFDYYGSDYDAWAGFAVSGNYDKTTAGYTNQFSAHASDSGNFGIVFFSSGNGARYETPTVVFEEACEPLSVMIANNTYAYMECVGAVLYQVVGNFYFTVTITGYLDGAETGSLDVGLSEGGVAISDWTEIDLTGLGEVDALKFSFDSNYANTWGMLTPAYCCVDNLKIK